MEKILSRKMLLVVIITFCISISFIPQVSCFDISVLEVSSFDGNVLYVGCSGSECYDTIQSAINDAQSGDTIFVYDDSSPYYENIVVAKSINLIGEDRETTIIYGIGNGDVVLQIL